MALVSISLGSNIDRTNNIRSAISKLRAVYNDLFISPVYQTEAVGFSGDDFYNLVVGLTTQQDVYTVVSHLKSIEDQMGRDRSQPKFSARSIDLDLLTYDNLIIDQAGVQIPRHEILQNAFVLKPLSDILGGYKHPELDKTYHQLWLEMEPHAGRIERIDLDL